MLNDGRKLFMVETQTIVGVKTFEVWALDEQQARAVAEQYAEQLHVAIQVQTVALAVFH